MDQPQNIGFGQDTLVRLRGLFPSLSQAERKVGEYVLNHADKVIRLTLPEIAHQAG